MAKSRTAKTLLNTASGILNRVCNTVLSFILRTIFIYTLGIQYTGVSSVFNDILTMLSLSELGISTAIATALYKPLHDKDDIKIRKLMSFYRNAYRYIALFIIIIGIILLPFLKFLITGVPDIKENIQLIFIFYIIKTAASYLLIYKSTILNADQKQYVVKGLESICTIVRYFVEIVSLIIFKNFMIYLVIEVFATVIQNIVINSRAAKKYPEAFKLTNEKLNNEERKNLLRDIKGLSMYRISGTIGNSIDNILISSFLGATLVGILSNYTMIRKQIETLVLQFFYAITPSIGSLAAEGNVEKQLTVFNRTFYISFIITNFCSIALFVLFTPFINLWIGSQYLMSKKIAFVIAFDSFLYILLQAIASFRTANGLFVKGQYRPLITAALNIVLSVLLINKFGILGTIVATIIARISTQWYDAYILYKDVFKKKFWKFYLKYWAYIFIYIIGCFTTLYVASIWQTSSKIFNLIFSIGVCMIVPNFIAILFTFKTDEFKYLVDIVKRKILKKRKVV